MSAKNVVAIAPKAPKAKPAFVTAIRSFWKARQALTESLKGATAQDVVLAVAEVTGCAVKKSTSAKAATEWVLDSAHANYEGAKSLRRDVNISLAGEVSRGKKQHAANKVATPEKVLEAYLSLDTKARATFRRMAKLSIAK
ncbi:hypothetical protein EBZ39_16445 [bacterium]|nr:hypothetical protein [bacterium]